MNRKLNIWLLAWVLGSLTIIVMAVLLLHQFQIQRHAGIFLAQANRALQEGKSAQAVAHLQAYLAYIPDDTAARVLHAQTLLKLGGSPATRYQTLLLLEQILRSEPGHRELRRQTVELAQELYRTSDAARHLKVLLQTTPGEAELWYRLGWCQEVEGDFSQAQVSYNRALALDAHHLATYERLGNLLLLRLDQPNEVQQLLDRMVAANKDSYLALLGRARYLRTIGETERAWEDVRQAVHLASGRPEVVLLVAEMEFERGDHARARAELQRGLQANPGDVRLIRTLAWLELQQDRITEAMACLQRGLEKAPNSSDLLVALTDLTVEKGPAAEARALVERVREKGVEPGIVECLEARLSLQQQEILPALEMLERAQGLLRSPAWMGQVAYLLGQCYEQLGDLNEAMTAYRQALHLKGNWTVVRQALARTLLVSGRCSDAVLELQQVRAAPDATALTQALLARALLEQNLRLLESQRDWHAVEQCLQRAIQAKFDPVETAILQAEIQAARGKKDAAAATLRQARDHHPGALRLWLALADLAHQQQQRAQAQQLLEEAAAERGDSLELRLAWIRFWSNVPGATARQGLLRQERNLEKLLPGQQVRLQRELAASLYRQGDFSGAERLWTAVSQRLPRDLSSRLLLFELALQTGQESEAQRWLEALKKLEGQPGKFWRYAEAALLVTQAHGRDRRKLQQATEVLKALSQQFRDWGRPHLLLGAIAQWRGQPEQAIQEYQRALLLGEVQAESVVRLTRLLLERGRNGDADQALRKVEVLLPLDRELTRLAAEVALRNQDRERALVLAREVVTAQTRDYRDHLWLANLLVQAHQSAEAEQVLRQALQHSGSIPEVWVALVGLLGQKKEQAQIDLAFRQLREQVPAARVPATLARCHEVLGQAAAAEKLYRQAWSGSVDDFMGLKHLAEFYLRVGRPGEAEPLLRQLLAPGVRLPAELLARARQLLARALAAGGDDSRCAEALQLLARNEQLHGWDLEDARVRAFVLARRPKTRKAAIAQYERLQEQRSLEPEDLFVLGKLYAAENQVSLALEGLQRLVTVAPREPEYLATYVRLLLQASNLSDARFYLDRLHQLEPQAARTQELQDLLDRTRKKLAAETN